ncbi:hypothetical protein HanXRQr2_Chr10g0453831 [Helianthus annuus]|uniref:Uncharacterized protein n=1 Tax=Helianthus annuus TaxID=4232 RepID=A0A9K3I060_HELAN|nr:hypothetical protein HanXRQr2_Chr10g0453831 [Helianthus annuus]KAJ0884797.1 hypothetical protein HanPSC8_Chr10g0438021 [Helianthus annuus]
MLLKILTAVHFCKPANSAIFCEPKFIVDTKVIIVIFPRPRGGSRCPTLSIGNRHDSFK